MKTFFGLALALIAIAPANAATDADYDKGVASSFAYVEHCDKNTISDEGMKISNDYRKRRPAEVARSLEERFKNFTADDWSRWCTRMKPRAEQWGRPLSVNEAREQYRRDAKEKERKIEAEAKANMNPESLAIRTQYENWARDNSITMWSWTSIVGKDLQRAVDVILYNRECAPVRPEKLHRMQVLLDAFPDWNWSDPKDVAQSLFNALGRESWCRRTNPTPLPAL